MKLLLMLCVVTRQLPTSVSSVYQSCLLLILLLQYHLYILPLRSDVEEGPSPTATAWAHAASTNKNRETAFDLDRIKFVAKYVI